MEFSVGYNEYVFGGLRQRTLVIEGTPIAGTAVERRTGGWVWFLRRPDGELAGEGSAPTWEGVLRDIRDALATADKEDRLGNFRRDASR